jgi:hypothetical protein
MPDGLSIRIGSLTPTEYLITLIRRFAQVLDRDSTDNVITVQQSLTRVSNGNHVQIPEGYIKHVNSVQESKTIICKY